MSLYRAGWIHFTNAAPILDNLELPAGVCAVHGVPTQMNQALLSGKVDIANISAVEFIRHANELEALPDFSISVLGSVYSVNLFHKKPFEEIKNIALTSQSSTSIALLEILLKLRGLNPSLVVTEGSSGSLLAHHDAVLRIGDDALREWYEVAGPLSDKQSMTCLPNSKNDITVTDLSNEWFKLTHRPFTFAVWAYRKNNPPPNELLLAMRLARRQGIGNLSTIAARHALRLSLPERVVQHYLWNFRYHLEEPDQLGLGEFAKLAEPNHAPLTFAPL